MHLINQLPSVRYNDLAQITERNNRIILYSLCILDKNYYLKVVMCLNGR